MEDTPSPMSRKRALAESVEQTQSILCTTQSSTSVSTSQSGLGSPTVQPHKRPTSSQQHQHMQQAAPVAQFPVLDYHMQQCHQSHGCYLNNTLQPADSSTWSNWQQLPVVQQLELLNQASSDAHMADSQPQLTRANSAPELVKLTQADSAAWQQAHAASSGGANLQPASAALLSHKDFWVV